MKNYNNVVIVFPMDPSIEFLNPIIKVLLQIFPEAKQSNPQVGSYGDDISDETDLIIFLGHGTPSFLYGRLDDSGNRSVYMDITAAKRMFEGTAVILFSCNSWDYLKKFKLEANIDTFLTFGDMPTDWDHINHNRKYDATFLKGILSEHLEFYKTCLAEALIAGFKAGSEQGSFVSIPKQISLFISEKVNQVILTKPWSLSQKLQIIQLLVNFRSEMKYAQPLKIGLRNNDHSPLKTKT